MSTSTADITAYGPVNGMCEPDTSGAYIALNVAPKNENLARYRISIGAAEVLAAELAGLLDNPAPKSTPTDSRDERLRELATCAEDVRKHLENPFHPDAERIKQDLLVFANACTPTTILSLLAERDDLRTRLAAASPLAALVPELVGALQACASAIDFPSFDNNRTAADRRDASRQARQMITRAAAVTAGRDGG